ncbi:MAG TPA: hypothetical protein VM737_09175 [Gemmatimonadota bacterium]|nr:hypothetical protein [Gemmatimonadota bacterium]
MRYGVLLAMTAVAILAACGGGGYGGPTTPPEGLDVSGTWTVTSTIVENTCGIDLPTTSTATVTITQNGTRITFRIEGLVASGTIDLATGEYTISAVIESEDGQAIIEESGRFSSNDRYTADSSLTLVIDEGSCVIRTSESGRRQT